MTNKEKYKKAFSVIHTSENLFREVKKMENVRKRYKIKKMVILLAACMVVLTSAVAVYAFDLGGIQRIVQIWIYGEQTNATITFDGNGNYNMEYVDEYGNTKERGGGGVKYTWYGREIPLSPEELTETLNGPDVRYEEDGRVMVYWLDQKIDITNKFKNGVCYVKLVNEKEKLYMTIKYKDGCAISPKKYIKIDQFN